MTGNTMTMVAIPWFVLQTTGSATLTGITGAVAVLPMVLGAALGGALVDRLGFRRASITADLSSATAVGLIPLLHHTVGLAYWQLLVLVFLRGLLDMPGNTARTSLLPDLAEMGGLPLEAANAALQSIQRGAVLVGPMLAGVAIAVIGASRVLWVDAATFALSAALVALTVPSRAARPGTVAPPAYAAAMREGLRFVRGQPLFLAVAATLALTNMLDGYFTVLLPVYAQREFGRAVDLGVMFSAFGAGSLTGALLFGRFGRRLPRRLVFAGGLLGVGAGIGVMVATPPLGVLLVAFAAAGVAAGPINPMLVTVYQERTPAALRGRVLGLLSAMALSAMPIGRLAAGFVIDAAGVAATAALVAAGYLVAGLASLFMPQFRMLDRRGDGVARGTLPDAEATAAALTDPSSTSGG